MSHNTTRCAACRYLRRRCDENCILAPYFPYMNPERFTCVHRIFGASNVSRMLQQLPIHERRAAADAISSEAYWRVRDPVYGCVGVISMLQQEIHRAQRELAETQAQIAMYNAGQMQLAPPAEEEEEEGEDIQYFDVQPNVNQFGLDQTLFGFYQPPGLP